MIYINTVDHIITDRLNSILFDLEAKNEGLPPNSTCTINGFQTDNLCYEPYIQDELKKLLEYLPNRDLKYRWFHMINYKDHGYQDAHDHSKTEDYSYILYLTDCDKGGETIFINGEESLAIKPEKNKLVFFPANLWHKGNATIDNKKVAVRALIV